MWTFQRCRTVEDRAQANQVVSVPRVWHTCIQRRVLTHVHHLQEVDYTTCSLKRAHEELSKRLEKNLFKPNQSSTVRTNTDHCWVSWSVPLILARSGNDSIRPSSMDKFLPCVAISVFRPTPQPRARQCDSVEGLSQTQ